MRAPGEASGVFAIESAMDELAVATKVDPVELRLRNYTETDPSSGKPFASKALRECYEQGAEAFGWSKRDPAPRSMRDGRVLVGWGMATSTYPTNRSQAEAKVRLNADGTAVVQSGTQDLGTGTYTVLAQVAADALGLADPSRPRRDRRQQAAARAGFGRLADRRERRVGRARRQPGGARGSDPARGRGP